MNLKNFILNVDSYKTSQFNQLPPKTNNMYAYIEAREKNKFVLFFGLQMFLKEYMSSPITLSDIDEAEEFLSLHGVPFNRAGWERIVNVYGGNLPIAIYALEEGHVVPSGTVLVTIENLDMTNLPWLTSYVETALLRGVWYPSTVASNSFSAKEKILRHLNASSDDPEGQIPFKLHDFGARGVSSFESAGIGGCSHLVNFRGTDTITGLLYARKFYNELMAGYSIPGMEHSTVTAWGRHSEIAAYSNMLDKYLRPKTILAAVSDSYDLWNAVKNMWGDTLRERVMSSGAVVVVRPDSEDPITTPTKVVKILEEKFGVTVNNKGYKVLHPSIRVIQGDGINNPNIDSIYYELRNSGYSTDNLNLGMGGQLLQGVTRDDYSFAQKNSAINIDGVWSDTYKEPSGAPEKNSKRGRFMVIKEKGDGWRAPIHDWKVLPLINGDERNMLKLIWSNGVLIKDHNFNDIRLRSEGYL
jgi:nicotinamide phosphoribosyltransferase